ncbi:Bacterio-opsin activator HTH domain protein [Halorubrum coriense DSM 10284]|uniref:Bacterio-opsin activator HTH domain protein n=1 Tax=Halorubrum coriense DSM 10284 TaxID=1227466 RepID=M0EH11_9EURY|nr:helix-turn-helix domain-containing protein [Halorubrum coriense]ELZ47056.1 Bacterio-opsin activator HTH domain protein [Halorubrum coriense DSM 10284]
MATTDAERSDEWAGTRLTLDLWHPNCWAIEATNRADGGVLAHAIYNSPRTETDAPNSVNGLFTAFGDTNEEVEALLDAISESDRAGNLLELQERFGRARDAPGNVVREFFLEYDPADMVCPTLLEHGFVHSAPVRIEGGREEWQVCFVGERTDIRESLDAVQEASGAEVSVESMSSSGHAGRTPREHRLDTLTTTQRKVFEHAREAGYYEWPREASTRELADDMDVSKTTLLEHLRKAESKLLDP